MVFNHMKIQLKAFSYEIIIPPEIHYIPGHTKWKYIKGQTLKLKREHFYEEETLLDDALWGIHDGPLILDLETFFFDKSEIQFSRNTDWSAKHFFPFIENQKILEKVFRHWKNSAPPKK